MLILVLFFLNIYFILQCSPLESIQTHIIAWIHAIMILLKILF